MQKLLDKGYDYDPKAMAEYIEKNFYKREGAQKEEAPAEKTEAPAAEAPAEKTEAPAAEAPAEKTEAPAAH
jgi:small subunit ribosomal protein S2